LPTPLRGRRAPQFGRADRPPLLLHHPGVCFSKRTILELDDDGTNSERRICIYNINSLYMSHRRRGEFPLQSLLTSNVIVLTKIQVYPPAGPTAKPFKRAGLPALEDQQEAHTKVHQGDREQFHQGDSLGRSKEIADPYWHRDQRHDEGVGHRRE
jgi:hypothetical protein